MRTLALMTLLVAAGAHAGDAADVDDLSLDALLNTPVEVTTKDARSAREAPGVVLVVTREQIQASGARDLLEVLQLVPGFTFHQDVEGVVGIAFRGLWGHEGKVLVMLDGQEVNELLYSTTQFGHHVLPHQVDRVEVIRGPGSAIYGGTAELAVINVITRSGRALQGGAVSARYANGLAGLSDWSVGASLGARHEERDLEWSVHAAGGEGRRTLRDYTDFLGTTFNMKDESLDTFFATAGAKWKGLSARLTWDDYRHGARVGYGEVQAARETLRFRTLLGDAQYDIKLSDTLTLRPRLNARLQVPWRSTRLESPLYYDVAGLRVLAGVMALWTPREALDVMGGVETYVDHAWEMSQMPDSGPKLGDGVSAVTYANVAAWAQALWNTSVVNVTAGGRLEVHSQVGVNVAPRVALTRQLDRVNLKLLYGSAFRSPGVENLALGPNVTAERTHVVEAEVGVRVSDIAFVSANGFYTALTSPIIYGYDPVTDLESYFNGGAISTAGAELLFQLRGARGLLDVTYSLAVPVVATDVDTYLVPGDGAPTLLGMPMHKVTLTGRMVLNEHLALGGSAYYLSDRWAWATASSAADGTGQIGWIPDALVVSAWLGVEDLGVKGLSAQVGVGNLTDANVPFVQPYEGGMAPIPGRGREVFLRLQYAHRVGE